MKELCANGELAKRTPGQVGASVGDEVGLSKRPRRNSKHTLLKEHCATRKLGKRTPGQVGASVGDEVGLVKRSRRNYAWNYGEDVQKDRLRHVRMSVLDPGYVLRVYLLRRVLSTSLHKPGGNMSVRGVFAGFV